MAEITVYTVIETSKLLKCSDTVVRQLIANGRLVATNLAGPKSKHKNYRITSEAIRIYLDGSEETPARVRRVDRSGISGKTFMKLA